MRSARRLRHGGRGARALVPRGRPDGLEEAGLADLPALELGREQVHVLTLLGGELPVQLALDRPGRRLAEPLLEELHGALLERDRDPEQVARVLRLVRDASVDRRAVHLEVLGRGRHRRVVAAGQRRHVLLLHLGELPEQLLQERVGRLLRGARVERLAAELDLERDPDGLERRGLLDLARVENLQLAAAGRAHPVREREALAHLAAVVAAPLELGGAAADVLLVTVDRLVALRALQRGRLRAGRGRAGVRVGAAAGLHRLELRDVLRDERPLLAGREVRRDRLRRAAPGPHREDHGGAAGNDVAAREHALEIGRLRRLGLAVVRRDVAPLGEADARRGLGDDRVRLGAERDDDGVAVERLELARRHRLAAPLLVRLAEDHLLDLHPLHIALGIREDLDRRVEEEELDPLLLRVADLLDAGRRLRLGAAVDAADGGRAEPLRDAQAVHRGVAGADDGDVLADGDGRVLEREDVAAHEVHAGEELVRRVDLARVLAGDPDERRGARADAEEHGVVALLLEELRDGEGLADDLVRLDLHALVDELLHLAVDDLAREAEGRDAVLEHAAHHVERLVDRHVGAELHEVGGGGEAGGAGAADRDLAELLREARGRGGLRLRVVADEALEAADADRLDLLADHALRLALRLLRADAAADRGEGVRLLDDLERAVEVADRDVLDERRDVDRHRAARHAGRLRALDAALRLAEGLLEGVAEIDLLEVPGALLGVALRHVRLLRGEVLDLAVVLLVLDEELLLEVADVGVVLGRARLEALEALLPGEQLLEVDLEARASEDYA